jgi:hypothetical protein
MTRSLRAIMLGVLGMILAAAAGCGSAGLSIEEGATGVVPNLPPVPSPQTGVSMPALTGETFDLESYDKGASATYNIFFRDSVNEASAPRWSATNISGKKAWTLSNSSFSPPKAWVMGGNYWNAENDDLFSDDFTVATGTDGLALTFYTRYSMGPGDNCVVNYFDGQGWQQVVSFPTGSNPNYPAWDKFYFKLPKNITPTDQICYVNFHFDSNNDGNNQFGFGVDSVAVYQTQLAAPDGLNAVDSGNPGQVDLAWNYTQQGNLVPDNFNIYRAPDSGGVPGTYAYLNSIGFPTTSFSDMNGTNDVYWYKVVAAKGGWPESADSNEDFAGATGSWTTLTIDDPPATLVGKSGDIAMIGGFPAIAYRDETNLRVRYAHSSTLTGSQLADWTVVTLPPGATLNPGKEISLAEVGGFPAIAFQDEGTVHVNYQHGTSVDGSSWNVPLDITPLGLNGGAPDLVVVNGRPACMFDDFTNNALHYLHSTTASGDGVNDWSVDVTLDDPATGAANSSALAVVNGDPATAWFEFDGVNYSLRYSWSTTPSGDLLADWGPANVTNAYPNVPSLTLINGLPALSFQDFNTNDTWFQSANDASGFNWNAPVQVKAATGSGAHSLSQVAGNPAVCFYDTSINGDLIYVRSTTSDGSSGWTNYETVDSGSVGNFCAMITVDSNSPAIYYYDQNNSACKYAVFQ